MRVKEFRKFLSIARVSLTNSFAYRVEAISGLMFYTMFIFVFFSLWSAIYRGGQVNGYSRAQVVWYLIVTEMIAFALRVGSLINQVSEDVKTGSLAYALGRPMHYMGFQAALAAGNSMFNLALYGVLAAALGLMFVGPIPGFCWWALPMMAVSFALGVALQFFLSMAIALSAFFLEDNGAVYLIYQKLVFMLGVFLPVEFLPAWLQRWAKVLPFSYVAWAPARLFVAFSWEQFAAILPWQILWTAAGAAIALGVFRAGTRRLTVQGG